MNFGRNVSLGLKEKLLFHKLDEASSVLLASCSKYATPYIVTNAAAGWVEYSSRLFLPQTYKILLANKVKIISARSNYEGAHPNDPTRWKFETFFTIGSGYSASMSSNIICIGDSDIEMDAAMMLGK